MVVGSWTTAVCTDVVILLDAESDGFVCHYCYHKGNLQLHVFADIGGLNDGTTSAL
jgi:hypothetical protein